MVTDKKVLVNRGSIGKLRVVYISSIGLAKTFAPSFKKRPGRLSKPAALDTLVFFKIFKMAFSETVAKLKESV